MCAGIITGWFSPHGKDSVAGLCNRPSPLWDFCLQSSSLMMRPLVVMASLTCTIVICGPQTILMERLKHLISSGSTSMCGQELLGTAYLGQFCFHNAWTEKYIWPSCKTRCLHCWRMCLWQYNRLCSCRTMEHQPTSKLMYTDTSTSSPDIG